MGIYFQGGSDPTVIFNIIRENVAQGNGAGGGLAFELVRGTGNIANNVIAGNTANRGGGINVISLVSVPGRLLIVNNTIVGNRATSGGGGGGICTQGATVVVRDSIVTSSTSGGGISCLGAPSPSVTYCDVWGNSGGDFVNSATASTGCISTDPLFADPANGNYRLRAVGGRWDDASSAWVKTDSVTSPCIDAGDTASACNQEPAPNGGRVNIGFDGNTVRASKSAGP